MHGGSQVAPWKKGGVTSLFLTRHLVTPRRVFITQVVGSRVVGKAISCVYDLVYERVSVCLSVCLSVCVSTLWLAVFHSDINEVTLC